MNHISFTCSWIGPSIGVGLIIDHLRDRWRLHLCCVGSRECSLCARFIAEEEARGKKRNGDAAQADRELASRPVQLCAQIRAHHQAWRVRVLWTNEP